METLASCRVGIGIGVGRRLSVDDSFSEFDIEFSFRSSLGLFLIIRSPPAPHLRVGAIAVVTVVVALVADDAASVALKYFSYFRFPATVISS